MMWFEELMAFTEESPQQVRKNITIDGDMLRSHVNGKSFTYGMLETPSLADLRQRVRAIKSQHGKISVREVVADVQKLHTDESNSGALFQVASQFNLLEMPAPYVTPEAGVANYERDLTQGPACAVAAGAGTIYRNYFADVNRQVGQSVDNQIDCLADIGEALGNTDSHLWGMNNGYAMVSAEGLIEISERLELAGEDEIDGLRELLRVGVQWNTDVTIEDASHMVSQVYCSALPVGYSNHPKELWERFARLVLEASYEATLCAAILNSSATGCNKIFLTLVGGGVFGNHTKWIISAIKRSLNLYRTFDLDVSIVSHGASKVVVQNLLMELPNH